MHLSERQDDKGHSHVWNVYETKSSHEKVDDSRCRIFDQPLSHICVMEMRGLLRNRVWTQSERLPIECQLPAYDDCAGEVPLLADTMRKFYTGHT